MFTWKPEKGVLREGASRIMKAALFYIRDTRVPLLRAISKRARRKTSVQWFLSHISLLAIYYAIVIITSSSSCAMIQLVIQLVSLPFLYSIPSSSINSPMIARFLRISGIYSFPVMKAAFLPSSCGCLVGWLVSHRLILRIPIYRLVPIFFLLFHPSSPFLLRYTFLAYSERRPTGDAFVQDTRCTLLLVLRSDFFLASRLSVRHLCCLTVVCNGPCETRYYSQPLCITVTQMTNIDISLW